MKTVALLFICMFMLVVNVTLGQKPKDGTYTYSIAFAEWNDKTMGATCNVVIKGDSIRVVHNGQKNLSGKKRDVIAAGKIMKHSSGAWIIGHSEADKNAKEIGGCSDGPVEIDFKNKKIRLC